MKKIDENEPSVEIGQSNQHEFIAVRGVMVCHWCGMERRPFMETACASKVKLTTKGGKLTVERR